MLSDFIALYRDEIITRSKGRAARRACPPIADALIGEGIPWFLARVTAVLDIPRHRYSPEPSASDTERSTAAPDVATLAQAAALYDDTCQAIMDVAAEGGMSITGEDLLWLHHCLDDAIEDASVLYPPADHEGRLRNARGQRPAGGDAGHEMRNLVHVANLAIEALPLGGSTSGPAWSALVRSVHAMRDIIARSVASSERAT